MTVSDATQKRIIRELTTTLSHEPDRKLSTIFALGMIAAGANHLRQRFGAEIAAEECFRFADAYCLLVPPEKQ